MGTEVKNTLFRFATMRAPELLEKDTIDSTFVQHPETFEIIPAKDIKAKSKKSVTTFRNYASVFLDAVNGVSPDKKKLALINAATVFEDQALKTREEVRRYVGYSFFDFAIWLTSNRTKMTIDQLKDQLALVFDNQETVGMPKVDNSLPFLSIFSVTEKIELWDNLFYQIVTYKSNYVREAILSVLVADFFISNFRNPSKDIISPRGNNTNNIADNTLDERLQKLAQARVIIPKLLLEKTEVVDTGNTGPFKTTLPINTKTLDKEMALILNQQKIKVYQAIVDELTVEQNNYNKLNQKAYDAAYKVYDKKVQTLYDNAKTVDKKVVDPITKETTTLTEFVNLKIPSFEFKAKIELDRRHLTSKVSEQTLAFVKELSTANHYDSFDEVIGYLNQEINNLTKDLLENSQITQRVINSNGVMIPVSNLSKDTVHIFSIAGRSFTNSSAMDIQILFDDSVNNADVVSAEYTVILDSDPPITKTTFQDSIFNGKLAVTLVPEKMFMRNNNLLKLSGKLSLSNGSKINFTGGAIIDTIRDFFLFYETLTGNGTFKIELPDNNIDSGNLLDYVPSGFGIKRLGIADYRKVEQEICCYVPGEVSHIENIMASEYKERATRRLRRSEDTITTTKETETEKLTDSTSTERFEMNQQVASVIAEDTHVGASINASYSYGQQETTGVLGLNAGADFANNTTSEESNNQAVTHAKDVTERVLERVVKKVKEERILKVIEEFEENNKHGYDNRNSAQHVSGVYRWVDKIYRNQVLNYGKRLMYEFMIPEPAIFHVIAINEKKNNSEAEILVKPIDPRVGDKMVTLKSHKDVTEVNYQYWAGIFSAQIDPVPETYIFMGKSYSEAMVNASNEFFNKSETLDLKEGYKAIETEIFGYGHWDMDRSESHSYGVTVGNAAKFYEELRSSYSFRETLSLNNIEGKLPISYQSTNYHSLNLSITVKLSRTRELYEQWQIDTFNKIIRAYETKLSEYNAKVAQAKAMQAEKVRTNPLFYRQIENTVLRKNCIEYLASHEVLGAKSLLSVKQDVQNIQVLYNDPALETYTAKVKFFEQAFEWSLMSYNFYPFYWAQKSKWASLYNVDEVDDPIFRAFLQSGMARVIVTIRPGFEEAVNWYMATGQVWNGGQVPTMDDPLYISIVDELRVTTGTVEETWETRVPTSLTIIQAGSIGLEVKKALPCDDDCKDFYLFDSDGKAVLDANGDKISTNPFKQYNDVSLKGLDNTPPIQ
jgi:hypothetical protein